MTRAVGGAEYWARTDAGGGVQGEESRAVLALIFSENDGGYQISLI